MASIRRRKNADGTAVWQAQVRRKGQSPTSKSFIHKADAVLWATEVERSMRLGIFAPPTASQAPPASEEPAAAPSIEYTVADLIDKFLKELPADREKQRRNLDGPLREWKAAIGHIKLAALHASDIRKVKDNMLATKTRRGELPAPASVLRKLAAFSAALKRARNDWDWMEHSPMANVTKPRAAPGRQRFLDRNERERLLDACKNSSLDLLYPFVVVAISTGMRLGEIRSMRWENVDIGADRIVGRIALPSTKNGAPRSVALAGLALEEVRRLARLRRPSKQRPLKGYVFASRLLKGRQPIDIRRPWEDAVDAAGLKDFRFHDLRHSFASYMAMNGATPSELAEALGHKTLDMVIRYAHLAPAHSADLVARTNAKVFGQGAM